MMPIPDFEGPEVRAILEVMESHPPQYAVAVELVAPSGGHELRHDETVWRADPGRDVAEVRLRLETPGQEEPVTMALETLRERVALERAPDLVEVRIATWQRGVQYLVAPEYELADVLTGPDGR